MTPNLPAHLTPAERAALGAFLPAARSMLKDDLYEVRLYGSRARREGHEESDLDVALIVREGVWARRRPIHDLAWDLGVEHGVLLAATVIEKPRLDELRERELRFAAELDRDGISI